jgi:hypothetical protein
MSTSLPFVDIIGEAASLQLIADFGGYTVKIPKNPMAHHKLVKSIGLEASLKLCKEYGYGDTAIPLNAHSTYNQFIRSRAHAIDKLIDQGLNNPQIVKEMGVTSRTVSNHRSRRANPAPLLDFTK